MSLEDLIYRNRKKTSGAFATATPATTATHGSGNRLTVATVATVAVAKSKTAEAANDPAAVPADCVGALQSADGVLFLPWGPYLGPDDVRRMRGELVAMIETLAGMEQWDAGRRNDVLTRAIRGPLSDLMPNLAHFHERVTAALAEQKARDSLKARTWRLDGLDDRGTS